MHKQIDAALRAAEAAKKEIEDIRTKIPASDPNGKKQYLENAEMGAEWVIKQLQQLKNIAKQP